MNNGIFLSDLRYRPEKRYPTTVTAPINANKFPIRVTSPPESISLRVKAAPKNPIEAPRTCPFLTLEPMIGIRITTTRG